METKLNHRQLGRLNRDCLSLRAAKVQNFVYRIRLVDDPAGILCDAYVLDKAIKSASRATVIEHRDIDDYFGQVMEPDVIEWLNIGVLTRDEVFWKLTRLHFTIPNGEKIETFYTSHFRAR